MIRPEIKVLNDVRTVVDKLKNKNIHILFIPRRTYECDKFVFENIKVNNEMIDKSKVAHINMDLI